MGPRRALALITAALTLALLTCTVLPAVANLSDSATISTSIDTATVTPPTGVAVTGPSGTSCPGATLTFTVSWSPSTFSGATGYHVQAFWSTGGAAILDTTTGPGATSATTPQAVPKPAGAQTVTVVATVTTLSGTNWTGQSPQASFTCTQPSIGAPSPTSGGVGSSVTVTGAGFHASAPLTVTFGSVAATITSGGTTSANGDVNTTFTVPFSGNGSYSVTVSDGTTSLTSATSFTVTGSFDGVTYTGITMTGKSPTETCSSATIGQNTSCSAAPLGGTGSFTGSVTFVTAGHSAVANTGAAVTVTSAETTVSSPGGTVTPASSTVATGASTTSSAFKLTGNGGGWKATMRCSVTVNGVTYTVAVTGN